MAPEAVSDEEIYRPTGAYSHAKNVVPFEYLPRLPPGNLNSLSIEGAASLWRIDF